MAELFNRIIAQPWPPVAVLMLIGAVLGYLELSTAAAVAFMLAGLIIMFSSGRDTGTAD